MTNSRKRGKDAVLKFSDHKRKRVDELDADLDALFKLPSTEFTGERNALSARLKKSGRKDEAARVKALAKPSISAWAVNQLYWNYREAFDRMIASGERFHKAQRSGKLADMRAALDVRREALSHLSDLAASLLQDAGQNPSLDTLRRITATLEAISAGFAGSAISDSASGSNDPRPGRLTHDVDPPGFESFASFVPGMKAVPTAVAAGLTSANRRQKNPPAAADVTDVTTKNSHRKLSRHDDDRRLEEVRKKKIAAAKFSLQDAKRSLTTARARAQSLEAAQKKADAEAKKTEKHRRSVEANLEKAKAASEVAAERARSVAVEMEAAAASVNDAESVLEKASKELDSLSRQ
jgi:hypothetical protein